MRILVAAVFSVLISAAMAQEGQQATLTGFVSDQSRGSIARVKVTATNQSTGLARTVETNESGLYTIVALQPGTYTVRAASPGFKSIVEPGIVLDVGSSVRINLTLEIGAITETVTVQGAAPILKTETGEVSNIVSGTQVTELAMNGRNFTQFLALGTGVVSRQTGRQMGLGQEGNPLLSVHGGRISMNKYTYDGTLAMDTGGNRGLDLFPPMEAIGEVKVQKSNYGADSGGFGYGVVNIVTKAGGQQFHGDIYEYFRNDKLDARNFFSNQRQLIRLNNFGYTLGGPIYIPGKYNTDKSKDFFFWSQSWARRVGPQITSFVLPPQGVFTAQVPTEAMRRGDFSTLTTPIKNPDTGVPYDRNIIPLSQIDPNAVLLLKTFYPLPNRAGAQNFVFNTASFTSYREELIRWDHNFTQSWAATIRYAQDAWTQDQNIMRPSNTVLPTFPNLFGKPGKNLTAKLTTIVSPAAVNLFTYGYSFNTISNMPLGGQRPPGLNIPEAFSSNQFKVIPDITLQQGFASIGTGNILNNENPNFTWKDDFSLNLGSHTLKFGAEIIRHRKTEITYANEQGTFVFDGGKTGNAAADFLIGRGFTYTENDKDPGITVRQWDNELYIQDDFKATRHLTLNLGVRWYLIRGGNGGAADNDRISVFVPGLYDPAAAPRLLASGQLVPGTGDPLNGIITPANRRGLDVARDLRRPVNDAIGPRFGFAWSPGVSKMVVRGGYGINYFWGTDSNVPRKNNPPFNRSVNVQNPLLSNPLGGTNTIFPPNFTSRDVFSKQPSVQSWSLTIQRELMANTSLEIGYNGTRGNHLPRSTQLNQADPSRTGNANLRRPYLGYGTISYSENTAVSTYSGLTASLIRRFSRGLMFEGSYTFSKALGHVEGMPLDSRNKDLDRGLLDLDRTHMFTFNYVWEIPVYKGKKGVLPKVFGNWQLSGITAFQTGLPINVTQNGDVANFGGGTGAQRPDIIGDPNQGRGASLDRYFNVSAFRAITQTGRVGTSPINPLHGPGIANFDASLFKNMHPRESMRLQVGVESYNAFNHPQFEDVGAGINSATFGVVTSARDPRVLQLRAKLTF